MLSWGVGWQTGCVWVEGWVGRWVGGHGLGGGAERRCRCVEKCSPENVARSKIDAAIKLGDASALCICARARDQ